MKKFGLIGRNLTHSFSKDYFTQKFEKEGIRNSQYQLYPINEIDEFKNLVTKNSFAGLNVTIPFKEAILPLLDTIDPIAAKVQAVNTIKFEKNGKTTGYNTDVIGFKNSLKPFLAKQHTRALIFGTGGAAKAVAYILKEYQIPFYFVSRNPRGEKQIKYTDLDSSAIKSFKFLINCTPVGTFPKTNEIIPIDCDGITTQHLVYDLVYNPPKTYLLQEAEKRGALIVNGLSMLKLQAEESWKIWKNS